MWAHWPSVQAVTIAPSSLNRSSPLRFEINIKYRIPFGNNIFLGQRENIGFRGNRVDPRKVQSSSQTRYRSRAEKEHTSMTAKTKWPYDLLVGLGFVQPINISLVPAKSIILVVLRGNAKKMHRKALPQNVKNAFLRKRVLFLREEKNVKSQTLYFSHFFWANVQFR